MPKIILHLYVLNKIKKLTATDKLCTLCHLDLCFSRRCL